MCKRTHCVQNYTGVPFAFNMKKFLSLEIFYTHAVTDVTDNYQVYKGQKQYQEEDYVQV